MKFLHGFAGGCPPAPNFARARGISDCEWVQLSSRQKRELKNMRRNPAEIHVNQMYLPTRQQLRSNPSCHPEHMGRSVLLGRDPNPAEIRNREWSYTRIRNNTENGMRTAGLYWLIPTTMTNSAQFQSFVDLVWAAQVLSLWTSDGIAFAGHNAAMRNIVTRSGYNPLDVRPLYAGRNPASSPIPTKDLTPLLGPAVYGPDGIVGPQFAEILLNYVRSGTLMGLDVSAADSPLGFVRQIMDRLLTIVSSDSIEAAKADPNRGTYPASVSIDAVIPCNLLNVSRRREAGFTEDCRPLTGAAAPARGPSIPRRFFNVPDRYAMFNRDLGPTISDIVDAAQLYNEGRTPTPPPPPPPPPRLPMEGEDDGDDTLLYVGIALAMVAAGGGYVYYRNKKRRTAQTRPAIG